MIPQTVNSGSKNVMGKLLGRIKISATLLILAGFFSAIPAQADTKLDALLSTIKTVIRLPIDPFGYTSKFSTDCTLVIKDKYVGDIHHINFKHIDKKSTSISADLTLIVFVSESSSGGIKKIGGGDVDRVEIDTESDMLKKSEKGKFAEQFTVAVSSLKELCGG